MSWKMEGERSNLSMKGNKMNQKQIGEFLKQLRKEKGMTQEQLAEQFYVSGRTVSRWETGNNMPNISTLVKLADFFSVSIPELIDGERKQENMDEEVKKATEKLSGYVVMENNRFRKRMCIMQVVAFVGLILFAMIDMNGLNIPGSTTEAIASFGLGLATGMSFINILIMTCVMDRFGKFKMSLLLKIKVV